MRRTIAGAILGGLAWLLCALQLPQIPAPLVFYLAALAFVFGCGAPIVATLGLQDQPFATRTALACALGLAIAPVFICLLALCNCGAIFPPVAFVSSGVLLARWLDKGHRVPSDAADRLWYIALPVAVFAMTAWVSSGRMTTNGEAAAIYGDYDTLDLTYYAAIASTFNEATPIPPLSPFYADHRIVYSYFPLAFLAGVHKLTGVSMLKAFLMLGWPFFTSVASASVFTFFRRLGSSTFAGVTAALVFSGSGLAYLAGWWAPSMVQNDTLIWSSMFLAPSAEWLFFNPWAPTLAVMGVGFYALTRLQDAAWIRWSLVAGLCFGFAFMFKSFSFAVVVPALGIAAFVALLRREVIWSRLVVVAVASVAAATPWLLVILPHNKADNRGAVISVEFVSLVRRMLLKTDLTGTLETFVHRFSADPNYWILLTIASLIFLVGGLGARCLGLVTLVRAAIGSAPMRRWTPLAWIVILGVAMPFFVAVQPFPNSIQTYMFGMFALWPFAVRVIWPPDARPSVLRWAATAALVVCSVPATVHYAVSAHAAPAGKPLATLTEGDRRVIRVLDRASPTTTMMVQSEPLWPSLYAIESDRRVVLAWSSYVSGDESAAVTALENRIAALFGSPDTIGADDIGFLKQYHVTHVIERPGTDRLHPNVVAQLRLVTGTDTVRLYEVPVPLWR